MTIEGNTGGRAIGRYVIYDEFAAGGMATIHFGRLVGEVGFSRTVAIKRLHPQYARDPEFGSMFLDEARMCARIQHPNVVASLDIVFETGELLLVMEYVHGETFSRLLRLAATRKMAPPASIVASIVVGTLSGLHAAHTATSEQGEPLGIVHRDVSPQNIMVGVDGVARVLDFGVAKATMRSHTTSHGQVKGKLSYMSPEQLRGHDVDRRADVFAAAVVLWEALSGRRLFQSDDVGTLVGKLLNSPIEPPSRYRPELPAELDAVVLRGLARDPRGRFQSARDFARALARAVPVATAAEVGEWVSAVAADALAHRAELVATIEASSARMSCAQPAAEPRAHVVLRTGVPSLGTEAVTLTGAEAHSPTQFPGLTRDSPPPSVRPRRRVRSLALSAAALATLALFLVGFQLGRAEMAPERPRAAMATRAPSVTLPALAERPSTRVAESVATAPASVPDAVAKGAAQPAERAKPLPKRYAKRQRPNCDPPYRVDSQGIRRVRTECL